ncbi:hypothetical protein DPMN_002368 [Dreissena polymorpha]|uniref:Uncharacterized protein n=1 Tax=Dreissena polymorpha TaxID=45954 RepID=A0A9D4MNI7_DREPO|nr:hypothetical protein DPMN_002368 [Dreissena polymorpha]
MWQEDPNKVFTVRGKSVQNVKISSDSKECSIAAICVLPDRQVLVADNNNENIKLLDQQYQVVSHWNATTWPWAMCQISASEVAVTLENGYIHEVQFIKVNNRQLVTVKNLKLRHTCNGIACHEGDLYITADTALFKYTLNGKQVSKMYEDTSDSYTGLCKNDIILISSG